MIHQHTLANGLVLLAEPMDYVRSATATFMLPAGAAFDPADRCGLAGILADLSTRGAGDRDNRQLTEAFDSLGVDRSESIDTFNLWYSGSTLGRNIPAAIDLFAEMIRRPTFPEAELEPIQALAIQDVQSLDDAPQDKVMIELRKRYYPAPLNADKMGTVEGIEAITLDDVRGAWQRGYRPNGAIFAFAGNFDWPKLKDQIEARFGDWKRGPEAPVTPGPLSPKSEHLTKDTQQTQIAMAYRAASITDADYYAARGMVGVLSGGMSSRLFTEVREKRGLCYSVFATHETYRDLGTIVAYAGTRNERAQETLDVMTAELRKLKDGVTDDETDRVKAGLKSSLIMRQESTGARAGAIASDYHLLGRVRSFDEIQAAIDGVTPAMVADAAARWSADSPTVVTLGPKPLTLS
jgi:predicted Zn-dependent peptidase